MAPSRSGLDKTAHNSHTRQTTATSAVHTAYASGSICWKPGWRARAGVRAHRGRGNDNAPAPGIPNHPPGTAAIATPTLNWRAAGRAAHGRARGCIALRPFFTEQGRARHIALAGSPVTRNADSTTPLCAHLQCRVLHLALPQMKRCCLDGRLLRLAPQRVLRLLWFSTAAGRVRKSIPSSTIRLYDS